MSEPTSRESQTLTMAASTKAVMIEPRTLFRGFMGRLPEIH